MAGAYAAVVSVMTVMDNLHTHHQPPLSLHPKQAESLTQHLTFFEKFVESYDQTLPYSTEADPFASRIVDAAYAAEDAIESHIVDRIKGDGDGSDDSLYEALETVIQEMASIQKEAMEIKQTMSVGVQNQPMPLRSSSVEEKRSMVGADDLLLRMKEKLLSDWRGLQTIPVVGMGGTGKTTLAINIYQDRLIKEYFDICAWVTISQQYSIREILLEVLKDLDLKGNNQSSEDELGEILYKHLFGRRYLIVMDDMWSIGAWDEIRRFLPDNTNGSRIVVTTRLSNLASDLPNSSRLEMELLDEVSSWDLLSKIVFRGEDCPPELEDIGKEIGKSCKGLPLSIVVVGGFLAKSECTRKFWKYIEENLSIIGNLEDYELCLKVLHMSYKQLPVYLKPCFLYMGVFREDDVIRISKLVKLWVSEGFLKPVSGGSTLEEVARVYLKDLADRNLVLIDKMGLDGNIKSCKIHDLLRDLCLREAEKERFYTLTSQSLVNGQRRIVISKGEDISDLSSSPVRSLIWNLQPEQPRLLGLRLLRVLDSHRHKHLGPIKIIKNVYQLVNSRFLCICLVGDVTPLSIMKFWNLQTLIIEEYVFKNDIHNIWYMSHIRHIVLPDRVDIPNPHEGQDGIVLGNLQTLQLARNFKCSDQIVKRIPNIKKLKAWYDRVSLRDNGRDCFTNLDRLDKLESMHFKISRETNPSERVSIQRLVNFPLSLKKLNLRLGDSQYWEEELLDKIGSLPFLHKLTLCNGIFKDGRWKTTEGQFRSLKFLLLFYCKGLKDWITESSHFPCLTNLGLTWSSVLEEIPLEFAEVSTLRQIDLIYCPNPVVVSAKRIVEEYEELHGEADLHVYVRHPDKEKTAVENLAGPNFRVEWSAI